MPADVSLSVWVDFRQYERPFGVHICIVEGHLQLSPLPGSLVRAQGNLIWLEDGREWWANWSQRKYPGSVFMEKVAWSGRILSVQPRIRLTRSFDERSHSYLGYCLLVEGILEDESGAFSVGIGKAAQQKHQFQVGDQVSGESVPVADARREPVETYRASKLKVLQRTVDASRDPPPWHGIPPDLETYRWRGHRRLSARTYSSKCTSCIWGCRMAVEMIIDPWKRTMRYRLETFCYGPKSCRYYKAGPTRVVPGRKGMQWEEPDWVDEQETAHRAMDE